MSLPNLSVLCSPLADQRTHLSHDISFVDATIETLLDSSLEGFYPGLVFQLGLSQLTDGGPDHLAGIVIVAALNTLLNIAIEFIGQTYIPGRHGSLLRALCYSRHGKL